MSYLTSGRSSAPVVLLVHGNVTSSAFWEETMCTLCKRFYVVAPDLRGYGETEALPIDATRGLRDWSEDLHSFAQALGLDRPIHLVGWSLGGGVVMQYAIDHPVTVASLTLISPLSPFGFGGTKGAAGDPIYDDFAGSGGGTVNVDYVERIRTGDRGSDDVSSPRNVMNQFYFRPPFRASEEVEERFVDSMLMTRIGADFYPGSFEASPNWPGVAPGTGGVANAMSPRYVNLSQLAELNPKFPILWIRGDADQIVSDASLLDFGTLGKLDLVPGWPGEEVFPSQPMVAQTRYVLDRYQQNGGTYEEFIVSESGHSPHIEKPNIVLEKLVQFLTK
jgi:pimeloyl-ACP methyl ester carboxylesterase